MSIIAVVLAAITVHIYSIVLIGVYVASILAAAMAQEGQDQHHRSTDVS